MAQIVSNPKSRRAFDTDFKTKPPKLLTEITLLGAMETAGKFVEDEALAAALKESGIGTPATRATIIEGLLKDKDAKGAPKEPYVRRQKRNLVPTQKGIELIELLEKNKIDALTSPATAGDWEQKHRKMESCSYRREDFIGEIAELTQTIVKTIASQSTCARMACPCPKCRGPLHAGQRTIDCLDCGFKLRRIVAQRPLSNQEAEVLLAKDVVGPRTGFVSTKTGRHSQPH